MGSIIKYHIRPLETLIVARALREIGDVHKAMMQVAYLNAVEINLDRLKEIKTQLKNAEMWASGLKGNLHVLLDEVTNQIDNYCPQVYNDDQGGS